MTDVAIRIDPGQDGPYPRGTWEQAEGRWIDQINVTWGGPFRYLGNFVDISDSAYSVNVRRGRQDETEAFRGGGATVALRNINGRFDPDGPFPLRLRQPVQVRSGFNVYPQGTWEEAQGTWQDQGTVTWLGASVFAGFVEDVDLTYDTSGDAQVSLQVVDGLAILSNQSLLGETYAEEDGGARIRSVLDSQRISFPGPTDIDDGITPMQPGLADGNVTEYLRKVELSEQGRLFVSREGALTFRNRRADFGTPFVLADDGSGVFYSTVERYSGARSLFNRVLGRREGGDTFAFNNDFSQSQFNVRSLNVGDLLTASDTFVAAIITNLALRFAAPRTRVFAASIIVNRLDGAEQVDVLSLDFMSAVDLTFTPPNAEKITNELIVQGVEHSITVGSTWTTTLSFEERPAGIFLTLDDPVLGRLNENAMAF